MTGDAGEGAGPLSFLLRSLAWALASGVLLAGGLYAVGAALVAVGNARSGTSLGDVQLAALHAVFLAVLWEALLPHWLLSLASWLVLARLVPCLEEVWRLLGPCVAAVAALWFPVVGYLFFRAWKPTSAADVAHTWLLMTAGTAAALLLPRRLLPPLAPGAFARPLRRSTLKGR